MTCQWRKFLKSMITCIIFTYNKHEYELIKIRIQVINACYHYLTSNIAFLHLLMCGPPTHSLPMRSFLACGLYELDLLCVALLMHFHVCTFPMHCLLLHMVPSCALLARSLFLHATSSYCGLFQLFSCERPFLACGLLT